MQKIRLMNLERNRSHRETGLLVIRSYGLPACWFLLSAWHLSAGSELPCTGSHWRMQAAHTTTPEAILTGLPHVDTRPWHVYLFQNIRFISESSDLTIGEARQTLECKGVLASAFKIPFVYLEN